MRVLSAMFLMVAFMLFLALAAWHLERREREARLAAEALDASQLLDASLRDRLIEIDQYRHDLAALLQEIDYDKVRSADEA